MISSQDLEEGEISIEEPLENSAKKEQNEVESVLKKQVCKPKKKESNEQELLSGGNSGKSSAQSKQKKSILKEQSSENKRKKEKEPVGGTKLQNISQNASRISNKSAIQPKALSNIQEVPQFFSSNYKKVQCEFLKKGACSKGAECTFSHDFQPQKLNTICRFFLGNACEKGDECMFSHQLDQYPCKFYFTRDCEKHTMCPFSHEEHRFFQNEAETNQFFEENIEFLKDLMKTYGSIGKLNTKYIRFIDSQQQQTAQIEADKQSSLLIPPSLNTYTQQPQENQLPQWPFSKQPSNNSLVGIDSKQSSRPGDNIYQQNNFNKSSQGNLQEKYQPQGSINSRMYLQSYPLPLQMSLQPSNYMQEATQLPFFNDQRQAVKPVQPLPIHSQTSQNQIGVNRYAPYQFSSNQQSQFPPHNTNSSIPNTNIPSPYGNVNNPINQFGREPNVSYPQIHQTPGNKSNIPPPPMQKQQNIQPYQLKNYIPPNGQIPSNISLPLASQSSNIPPQQQQYSIPPSSPQFRNINKVNQFSDPNQSRLAGFTQENSHSIPYQQQYSQQYSQNPQQQFQQGQMNMKRIPPPPPPTQPNSTNIPLQVQSYGQANISQQYLPPSGSQTQFRMSGQNQGAPQSPIGMINIPKTIPIPSISLNSRPSTNVGSTPSFDRGIISSFGPQQPAPPIYTGNIPLPNQNPPQPPPRQNSDFSHNLLQVDYRQTNMASSSNLARQRNEKDITTSTKPIQSEIPQGEDMPEDGQKSIIQKQNEIQSQNPIIKGQFISDSSSMQQKIETSISNLPKGIPLLSEQSITQEQNSSIVQTMKSSSSNISQIQRSFQNNSLLEQLNGTNSGSGGSSIEVKLQKQIQAIEILQQMNESKKVSGKKTPQSEKQIQDKSTGQVEDNLKKSLIGSSGDINISGLSMGEQSNIRLVESHATSKIKDPRQLRRMLERQKAESNLQEVQVNLLDRITDSEVGGNKSIQLESNIEGEGEIDEQIVKKIKTENIGKSKLEVINEPKQQSTEIFSLSNIFACSEGSHQEKKILPLLELDQPARLINRLKELVRKTFSSNKNQRLSKQDEDNKRRIQMELFSASLIKVGSQLQFY